MRRDRRAVGSRWEEAAARWLRAQGLNVIAHGYVCRLGEIDLIAEDGQDLVIVEVRYRGRADYGSACESVDRHKQARIMRAARHFLMRHPRYASRPMRMDVVAIDGGADGEPSVTWLRNAFGGA